MGERQGFANLADLFAFLEEETQSSSLASGPWKARDEAHEESQEV
jgi:hypothetical protein